MLRILRAFAWLRWRVLLNSLERHGGRDTLERFSLAFEELTPVIVLLVMVPSAVTLAGAGAYAGWLLALGAPRVAVFEVLRFALLAGFVFSIVGPVMLPAGDRTNAVRLLLLPIPHRVLYLAQAISALVDPWMLLVAAVLISIPAGLAAGGAPGAAMMTGAAGIVFLTVLTGLTLVVTSLVQLAVRDRRRGEILALFFILLVPLIGLVPSLLDSEKRQRRPAAVREDRPGSPSGESPFARVAMAIVPSEVYVGATRKAARGEGDLLGFVTLIGAAAALHGLAFAVSTHVRSSPTAPGAAASRTRWGWRLPWVFPGTSAIALAQLRLGLRTPRGRSTILSPIVVFVLLAVMMLRSQAGVTLGFIALESGVGLAAFTSFLSLLSILPLAMNQFAIDGAGLTLALLAPIETRTLLDGKALGNALIAAIPAGVCLVGAVVFFPAGLAALWFCVPLSLVATYLLVAPAAAALSAIFPRAVDMNSLGRSNAHGTAGFIGTVAFFLAGAPCLLLVLVATRMLERPILALPLLMAWTAICAALSLVLFTAATALVERRRENLGMVV